MNAADLSRYFAGSSPCFDSINLLLCRHIIFRLGGGDGSNFWSGICLNPAV